MDTGQQFSRIALKTMGDRGFDQSVKRAAKVRNVSRLGSQIIKSQVGFELGPTGDDAPKGKPRLSAKTRDGGATAAMLVAHASMELEKLFGHSLRDRSWCIPARAIPVGV